MTTFEGNPVSAEHVSPESLGRVVRQAWVDYCIETGRTERPDHIAPWEELDEWSKEVDRRIGMAVATHAGNRARLVWLVREKENELRELRAQLESIVSAFVEWNDSPQVFPSTRLLEALHNARALLAKEQAL